MMVSHFHLTLESCNIPRVPDMTPPTNVSHPQTLARVHTRTLLRVGTSEHLGMRLMQLIVQEKRRIRYISRTPRNEDEELVQ